MAFENIQIQNGNFTLDRSGSSFFTLANSSQTLIEKNSSGSVIFNYTLSNAIIEVQSLQYDGYYFWSLEKQGTAGFRVRKWRKTAATLQLVNQYSYATDVINKYNVNSLAVESYGDSLSNVTVAGTTTFGVSDGSVVRVGDRILIGPSTAVGFEGNVFETNVIGKPTATTLTVSPAVGSNFSPLDPISFTRSFFAFSDTAPGGLSGALYKFRHTDGFPLALNVSNMFNLVRGSTFYQGKLLFVRGGEIIWLNPDSQNIFKSQAIDNINQSRSEYHTTYDLSSFSNTIYRLEQQHVFYNQSFGTYSTENWSPSYNFNTSSVIPEVYFVAVKAEPPILHKQASGIPTSENKSKITVTVLDQFRTPVFNRIVDLTSTGGPLSSIQETTDENGQVTVEYTANSSVGEVTITAEVS